MNILVVDDDMEMLRVYSRLLIGPDYSVKLAASLAEAAALMNENAFDLLITDQMLGDGLGTDLARMFCARFPGAKCLMVTGTQIDPAELELAEVSECMAKPLEMDRFMAAVSKALGSASQGACSAI